VDGGCTCIVMEADGAMVSEVVAEPEPVPLACGGIASVFVNGFEVGWMLRNGPKSVLAPLLLVNIFVDSCTNDRCSTLEALRNQPKKSRKSQMCAPVNSRSCSWEIS